MLAHGALLRKNFFNVEQMKKIIQDYHDADLSSEEILLMDFAQQIIQQPGSITQEDMDALHNTELTDEEILDIVVAVTARGFFSKTLDALAVKPDEIYRELEPELIRSLTIGRPFS